MLKAPSLFIISAASGTGKTTLVTELLKTFPDMEETISHTTREPRSNEREGVQYYFVNDEEFDRIVERDGFVEHANVFGKKYGTSKTEVERLLKKGVDIIFTIDVQGAAYVRKQFPEAISIFILPPSYEALEQRMILRQQDTPEAIAIRLRTAKEEIACCKEYDYLIVNDSLDRAFEELTSIIRAGRCRRKIQEKRYQKLLSHLLSPVKD